MLKTFGGVENININFTNFTKLLILFYKCLILPNLVVMVTLGKIEFGGNGWLSNIKCYDSVHVFVNE